MIRQRRIVRSRIRHRRSSTLRPQVEALGARVLLHGGGLHDHLDAEHGLDGLAGEFDLHAFPTPDEIGGAASMGEATSTSPSAALAPLGSIPILNSLLGAPAALYLDFDGHFEPLWGGFSNVTTPAFDQDGDATTFSDAELGTITQIWQYIAEDYAPLNLNVTTVAPPGFADGQALRVAIGGDGSWTGGIYGGIAYIDSFTNSIANTAYVFPANLANGYAKYTAEAGSHEAGHAFGLQHQSEYAGTTLISEYYAGPGDGRAPILGNSYGASRGLWWYGTSITATTFQDDLALLSRTQNGFGYRADDHGDTAATASPLTASGTQLSGAGIIGTASDLDVFSFSTGAGTISLAVSVPADVANLDAKLELRDAEGTTLITSADPGTSLGATVTATVAAGSYRLVVASHGGYGDLGQYSISGTVVVATGTVAAPTGLTASAASTTLVNLSWSDHATNETGYRVERSANGGTSWVSLATLGANATAFADSTATAGTTFQYRVGAFNGTATSGFSNVAGATTVPVAPTGLTATAASSGQINLSWSNVSGETGYRVERSTNGGATWTQVGTTGANVTTFQNTGLTASTTYQYRVVAINAGGSSAASAVASATTPAAPSLPTAPSGLVAAAASRTRVNLSWTDRSGNESGFKIERSTNGGKSWSQIATVGANATTYADTGVSGGKSYSYRVRAYNAVGNSSYSNVAQVTTPRLAAVGLTFGAPTTAVPVSAGVPGRPAGDVPSAVGVDQVLAFWTSWGSPARRQR